MGTVHAPCPPPSSAVASSPPSSPPADDVTLQGLEDPHNWSDLTRWAMVALVSLMGFVSPLGSSITVAGNKSLEQTMGLASRLLATVPVSTYLLGLALGPFLFAPASELVGRRPVYVATALTFIAFNAGTALAPNYPGLVVLRFFAGVAGSTGPTLGSGVIGDMFHPRFRGRAVAVYGLGPLLGPVVGNLISGYISQATHSFRWLLWTLTIISSAVAVAIIVFLQETYAAVLLERKKQHLAGQDVSWMARAQRSTLQAVRPWTWHQSPAAKAKFRLAMTRPFRLLFGNPICAIFSLYQGFVYGVMFIFLTQHPLLFQQRTDVSSTGSNAQSAGSKHTSHPAPTRRDPAPSPWPAASASASASAALASASGHHHIGSSTSDPSLHRLPSYGWSMGNAGLSYLGLGIGFLIAMSLNAAVSDVLYRRLVATGGRLRWSIFNPRVRTAQLAQETDVRNATHELLNSSRPGPDAASAPAAAPATASVGPAAQASLPQSHGILAGDTPPYSRDDTIEAAATGGSRLGSKPDLATLMSEQEKDTSEADNDKGVKEGAQGGDVEKQAAVATPAPAASAAPAAPAARKGQPEFRLPLCLLGMVVLPCGLLLFGWSASAKTHWSVPLLGSCVTGAGLILCFQTILMYLVDAFVPYSASATACSVLTRSVLAATFPLFAEYLFAALGYGWGSTLLAAVALAGAPVPLIMFYWGPRLRTRFAFSG